MNIPKLNPTDRSREYNLYSQEEKDSVIFNYLFKGLAHRQLDEKILGIDISQLTGYQSMDG